VSPVTASPTVHVYYMVPTVFEILSLDHDAMNLLHNGIMPDDFGSLLHSASQESGAGINDVRPALTTWK
jgi:hypothetical protein